MANFSGNSRTSYATIDLEEAKKFADKYGIQLIVNSEGKIGFLPSSMSEDGMFPSYLYDENGDCEEEFSFEEICKHIAPGEALVVMGCGSEKLRYLVGWAEAWSCEGLVSQVNLGDIYKLTKDAGLNYTVAEY